MPGHYCDIGNSDCTGDDSDVPTAFRCAYGCDFDVCQRCYDTASDAAAICPEVPTSTSPSNAGTSSSELTTTHRTTHRATTKTRAKRATGGRSGLLQRGKSSPSHAATTPMAVHTSSHSLPSTVAQPPIVPDVLVDASGARCELFEGVGLTHSVALKTSRAICCVVHLVNGKTPEEMRLQESTWSQQYHQPIFAKLAADGVTLQNFVYYRSTGAFASSPVHYFVMTTELDALATARVLHSTSPANGSEPTAASNVDVTRLESYARRAIAAFVPPLAAHPLVPAALSLFDFSERKQSNRAAILAPAASLGGGSTAKGPSRVLVTRVGDALQEPFWPEGLGINRGFLHALDCADLVAGYAALGSRRTAAGAGDTACERLLERREALYAYTKRVSGVNRVRELRGGTDGPFGYGIDPTTRYVSLPRDLPPQPLAEWRQTGDELLES